jgi:hypothetical protein
MNASKIYDVVVIGGGPAGMMAASRASICGKSVVLLEKNKRLGKKLSITGGGRCNVTNNKPVVRDMLSSYKDSGKYLFSTFMQHGVTETIQWFSDRNVSFVEENEGRLFLSTFKAETICSAMEMDVESSGVEVRRGTSVQRVEYNTKTKIFSIQTNSELVEATACIMATGGTSHPETGSTGEGFSWLESLGHTVIKSNMALVPVVAKDTWIARLAGITLPSVKITILEDGNKHSVQSGKLLFTHVGLTGPTILNMSKTIGDLLKYSDVILKIDLLPELDAGEAKARLQELLTESSNKKIKNIISELVPTALGGVVLDLINIDAETPGHSVSTDERKKLLAVLKALPIAIKELLGPEKAVVSDGGLKLEEVDFKTMESRIVSRLYLVGDVLNINRPSGGYSLQLCWSTGYVAGSHA